MAGWFNKEIDSVADIQGLKMRIPGFGGEIFQRAGLFHCLAGTAADLLTGTSSGSREWHQVYRALEHGKARSACQQQDVMRTFPSEVRAFGDTFIDLQKVRQQADYAHEGEYSKPEVLAIVNATEDAISKFEQADVQHRCSFIVHVLFKRRQP